MALLSLTVTTPNQTGGGGAPGTATVQSVQVTVPETTDLTLLTGAPGATGPAGPTGSPGISATFRGAWASGTTYTAGPPPDAVLGSDGNWYVSLSSGNIGHNPTTDGGVHWAEIFGSGGATAINVLAYGAVGDGVTDDTAAIQAAINAAHTAGGGTVYFPARSYRIATGLTSYSNITLRGEAAHATNLLFDDVLQDGILVSGASGNISTALTANLTEDDVTITVTSAAGVAAGQFVLVYATSNVNLGCWVTTVRSLSGTTITLDGRSPQSLTTAQGATAVFSPNAVTDAVFENLRFAPYNTTALSTRQQYLNFNYVIRPRISRCRFVGISATGSNNANAANFGDALDPTVEHCTMESIGNGASLNLVFAQTQNAKILYNRTKNTGLGITCNGAPYSLIHGNTVIEARGETGGVASSRGMKLLAGSNRSIVSDNHIDNCSTDNNGLFLTDSARCRIVGNVFTNVGNGAIFLGNAWTDGSRCKFNQVIGNQIHTVVPSAAGHNGVGILAQFGTAGTTDAFTLIANNTIENCAGNAIVALNNKDMVLGNIIKTFGTSNAALVGFDGAIGIFCNSGSGNVVANNMIDNAGVGAALYTENNAGGNYLWGNVLLAGEKVRLNGGDWGIPTQGIRPMEAVFGVGQAKSGVATLVAGTVTVTQAAVTANSRIMLTGQDNNVTGAVRISARTAGTSFTITSTVGTDTGKVAWEIFEPIITA